MAEGPRWVELTRTVGEINARLIAGDLENEEIRTHIELEGSAWFYAAEDPNRLATVYVLEADLERAGSVLEAATARGEHDLDVGDEDATREDDAFDEPGTGHPILAEQGQGLRSRPLRWVIAAVILGALLFGFMEGSFRELLR